MSHELIGILLAFAASVTAAVVSFVAMKSSKKTAELTNYLNTISVQRTKWVADMREQSAKYFTQLERLCECNECTLNEIYDELVNYHFTIVLLIFKEQDRILYDEMSAVKEKAKKIVECGNTILNADENIILAARRDIDELRHSILNDHHNKTFDIIRELIETEWKKQKCETKAAEIWEKIIKKTSR